MADLNVLTLDNLGSGFDIGVAEPGKVSVIAGSSSLPIAQAERTYLAAYTVTGDSNSSTDQEQTLTPVREDAGWSEVGDRVIWGGVAGNNASFIRVMAQEYMDVATNGGLARIAPELQLLKNGVVVAQSGSAYQRHATGHDSSSNTINWVDPAPVIGDEYRLRSRQGGTQNDTLDITIGTLSLEAAERFDVHVPVI